MTESEHKDENLEKQIMDLLVALTKGLQQRELNDAASEMCKNMDNVLKKEQDTVSVNSPFNNFYNGFMSDNKESIEMQDLAKKLKVAYLYINT